MRKKRKEYRTFKKLVKKGIQAKSKVKVQYKKNTVNKKYRENMFVYRL